MNDFPFVSVIIPARNEAAFIGACLESLLANNYPNDRLEILVIDGASSDATRSIAASYAARYPFIKIMENPGKTTPIAMNIGIRSARGDIITKTDAHSTYPSDYLMNGARALGTLGADLVGGRARATPSRNTLQARAIALTLSSSFGVGGSSFRKEVEKPQEADTVFGGFYRKEVFQKIGLFNERLAGSQDIELNLRLKRAGGRIVLVPDLEISYYPKPTLWTFFIHNVHDGIWAILPLKYGASRFKLRHVLPLVFVGGLAGGIALGVVIRPLLIGSALAGALYALASFLFSLKIAFREKDIFLAPFLMLAFAARHFGYGAGSWMGLLKLALPERRS